MSRFYADDAALQRIADGLVDKSLPKIEWTHAAHFAAALWCLRDAAGPPAKLRLPPLIQAYNAATGTPNTDTTGYHETITLASLGAARAFLQGHPLERPLHEIHDLLMASPLGDSHWLLRYWTRARLFSPAARRTWLAPDLAPLPFTP